MAMPDMVVNRVEVEVGDSPDKGLELIKTVLGNRRVQQSLLGLNVRLDNETRESLAYIVTQVDPDPRTYQAEKLQFFSYEPYRVPVPYYPEPKTALDKFIVPAEKIHPYDLFLLLKLSEVRISYTRLGCSPDAISEADYQRNRDKIGSLVEVDGKKYFESTSAIPSVLAKAYFKDCK